MKSLAKCLAALAVCSALVFGFAACANGSDGMSVVVPNNGTQNGGTDTTTTTTTPTETGGGSQTGGEVENPTTPAETSGEQLATGSSDGSYTRIGTQTINGVEYDIVTFGLYPQTVKATDVTINENETKAVGEFTYCKGSDGEWYVKIKENASWYPLDGYLRYTDGSRVEENNGYKWFKVEPIKWRVLTANYNGTGFVLLHAQNILIGKRFQKYGNSQMGRVKVGSDNYEYSEIRAWLNDGFINAAFDSTQQGFIADTAVDNGCEKMTDYGVYSGGVTKDKVFLLSKQEVEKNEFGLEKHDNKTSGNAIIFKATDFAKASGAYVCRYKEEGDSWWLRSPGWCCYTYKYVRDYDSYDVEFKDSNSSVVGVAPALCFSSSAVSAPVFYNVFIPEITHGSVTLDKTSAAAGETVTLKISADSGYKLGELSAICPDGAGSLLNLAISETGDTRSFTMPAQNVIVDAGFIQMHLYGIDVVSNISGGDGHCGVTADKTIAEAGDVVRLIITVGSGYKLESFSVADKGHNEVTVSGNGNEKTFTMPYAKLYVNAKFAAIDYNINVAGSITGGRISAGKAKAHVGDVVSLAQSADSGWTFVSWKVLDEDGAPVSVSNGSFTMPAKNVTVSATFGYKYNINVGTVANGNVTADKIVAIAGDYVTLTANPVAGYELASYIVTATDGTDIAVTNGKFTMPAQNVTVSVTFSAINYNINVGAFANGSVEVTPTTATVGASVTLTASPASGYGLASLAVTTEDGTPVSLSGMGDSRTFTMPASNVTVSAAFSAIYSINIGGFANGSVTANPASAMIGTSVTLTIRPKIGYKLETLAVNGADSSAIALSGTGNSRTFVMPAQNVTVTAATFAEIPAASGAYTNNGTTIINGTQYDLVTFGLWPQTIKAAGVEIDESQTKVSGAFTYCRGSDGQWYSKIKETAYEWGGDYEYSDGTTAAQSSADSYKWFKVEPIKWRVLTTAYNGTGKKLLLAENILTNCAYYDYTCVNRTINGNTIHPNNWKHSKVRAFLNGRSYQKKESDSAAQADCDDFLNKGFLQTAFTGAEIAIIQDTSVVNNARSTNPDANATQWNSGANSYASATPTTDKVFLLSEQEATTSAYGFDVYNAYKGDGTHNESARIRVTTDYAKASGANQSSTVGMGGLWWLRSPCCYEDSYGILVHHNGAAIANGGSLASSLHVDVSNEGIVPALCVSK